MTTIVYRDGVLAADSRLTQGGTIVHDKQRKIRRLADGSIIAGAGALAKVQRWERWIARGRKGKKPEGSFDAILLTSEKLLAWEDKGDPVELDRQQFYAWGSGSLAALGALHHGATAEEAVQCAIKVDCGSGGKVIRAKPKKRRRPT
jgi:ATP-dependent protease HslVU (ClpYQ) peptidase subunit